MENKNKIVQVDYDLKDRNRIHRLFEESVMYNNFEKLQEEDLAVCVKYQIKMLGNNRSQGYFISPGLYAEITEISEACPIIIRGIEKNIEQGEPILERLLGEEVFERHRSFCGGSK